MNAIEYLRLLRLTKDLYQFRKIGSTRKSEISEMISNDLLICFLRHDIDFSPKSAFDMAQMEEENGIYSSFTVLLGGEFYNPFEKKIGFILKRF